MMRMLFLSVILGLLSFPNPLSLSGFWPAAWIFAVPLFFSLERPGSFSQRVVKGCFYGFGFYALLVNWFIPYSLKGYLFFVVLLSLQPVLFAAFFPPPLKNDIFKLVYWPALWVASEYVRQLFMRGFSWNLGYSQTFNINILQWAGMVGAYGISFFLILCNTCLYLYVRNRKARKFLGLFILLTCLAWIGGAGLQCSSSLKTTGNSRSSFKVAAVQPLTDPQKKMDPWNMKEIIARQISLTEARLEKDQVSLILWPETAIPFDVREDELLLQRITDLCRRKNAGLLTGMSWYEEDVLFNGVVWIPPAGQAKIIYRKNYLVPFSEYAPWAGMPGRFLQRLLGPPLYAFTAGKDLGIFSLQKIHPLAAGVLGVAICSEDSIGAYFREYGKRGAGLIVLFLNDAWFKDRRALVQHMQNSIMRAVENRRPVLRVANSGWTGVIDAQGHFYAASSLEMQERDVGIFEITPVGYKSLYSIIGDSFCIMSMGFVIISQLLFFIRRKGRGVNR